MRHIQVVSLLLAVSLTLLAGISYATGASGMVHVPVKNTFQGVPTPYDKIAFTVIDNDPTLDEAEVATAIQDAYLPDIFSVYYRDGIVDGNLTAPTPVNFIGPLGVFDVYDIPLGIDERTVVIISPNDKAFEWKAIVNAGAAVGNRSYVIHFPDDNSVDLGIRILHELEHTFYLDADGMYTTQREPFRAWMWATGYPYKDFFENRYKYYGTSNNFYENGGQQVLLDYHLWLLRFVRDDRKRLATLTEPQASLVTFPTPGGGRVTCGEVLSLNWSPWDALIASSPAPLPRGP